MSKTATKATKATKPTKSLKAKITTDAAAPPSGIANTVLITNGFKSRIAPPGTKIASIPLEGKNAPTTFENLCDMWEKAIEEIPADNYVAGAGKNGVFTDNVAVQCAQLADPENTWLVTNGLGLINVTGQYPLYDLGDYDAKMSGITEDFDPAAWWLHVCNLTGKTIKDVVMDALAKGQRVVFALSPSTYYTIRNDLLNIPNDDETNEAIMRLVRFVGQGLKSMIPARFLPCVMSYEADDVNRLVPGSRSSCAKRAAMLLAIASPVRAATSKSPGTQPLKDFNAFQELLASDNAPMEYNSGTSSGASKGSNLTPLSDDDAIKQIRKCLQVITPDPVAISRMIRDAGHSMTSQRAAELLKKAQAPAHPKAK